MRAVDARRIQNRQGVLEESYWEAIGGAIGIELGFDVAFHPSPSVSEEE